jgi:hypothetical protein
VGLALPAFTVMMKENSWQQDWLQVEIKLTAAILIKFIAPKTSGKKNRLKFCLRRFLHFNTIQLSY